MMKVAVTRRRKFNQETIASRLFLRFRVNNEGFYVLSSTDVPPALPAHNINLAYA